MKVGENVLLATSSYTKTDGSVHAVGDAALAFQPGGGAAPANTASAWARAAGTLSGGDEPGYRSLTLARLRAGWEDGLAPLDLLAAEAGPAGIAHGSAAAGQAPASPDARLALMVQEMSAFGRRTGEAERLDRNASGGPSFDYYA